MIYRLKEDMLVDIEGQVILVPKGTKATRMDFVQDGRGKVSSVSVAIKAFRADNKYPYQNGMGWTRLIIECIPEELEPANLVEKIFGGQS